MQNSPSTHICDLEPDFSDTDYVARVKMAIEQDTDGALLKGMANRGGGLTGEAAKRAEGLGWIDRAGQLTPSGALVVDSAREYLLWKGRDRRLNFTDAHPLYHQNAFEGRKVVEIGCGAGMNLMSLEDGGAEMTGVEAVPIYVGMGRIFAEIEGRPTLDIREGWAEELPLPDASFDVALCLSAFNFFDLPVAMSEIERILKHGGEVFLISGFLGGLLPTISREILVGPGRKANIVRFVNSLSYTLATRRVFPQRADSTTARPVYPSVAAMRRIAGRAGLEHDGLAPKVHIGRVFRAVKAG